MAERYWCIRFSDGSLGAPTTLERAEAAFLRIGEDRRPLCRIVCLEVVEDEQRDTLRPDPFSERAIRQTLVTLNDSTCAACGSPADPRFFYLGNPMCDGCCPDIEDSMEYKGKIERKIAERAGSLPDRPAMDEGGTETHREALINLRGYASAMRDHKVVKHVNGQLAELAAASPEAGKEGG